MGSSVAVYEVPVRTSALIRSLAPGVVRTHLARALWENAEQSLAEHLPMLAKQTDKYESLLKMDRTENAYVIHKELGEWMTNNMTVALMTFATAWC